MDNNFIKISDDEVINQTAIKWMKKMDECIEICINDDCGVTFSGYPYTKHVCQFSNKELFNILNRHFDKK